MPIAAIASSRLHLAGIRPDRLPAPGPAVQPAPLASADRLTVTFLSRASGPLGVPVAGLNGLAPLAAGGTLGDDELLIEGEQGIGGIRPMTHGRAALAAVPTSLRVGLVVAQTGGTFQLPADVQVGETLLKAGVTYRAAVDAEQRLAIRNGDGELVARIGGSLKLPVAEGDSVLVNGKRYRGSLEVMPAPGAPGKLTIVNDVGLDDYLKGVLPAEMATGWPTDALRAQAVAARTYAVANLGRRSELGFDLYPTVADQVYGGMAIEAADTSAAVDATAGEVMTYDGAPINALFHSSSGHHTDDAMAVWDMDLPYIKGVADPDGSPNANWQKSLSTAQVRQTLTKIGTDVGTPTRISVVGRTPAGRARWLQVTGSAGTATVDAHRFRLASGLKSTMFNLVRTESGWRFDGSGYGHGLGMSQWGARRRAEAGIPYEEILRHYYTGIDLVAMAQPGA